jgi:uncharacterized secreted protein with C-terminal beta-propeller domain
MSTDGRKLPRIGVVAAAIAVIGAGVIGMAYEVGDKAGPDSPQTPPAVRLVAFDSCDKALTDLKAAATAKVGPWGLDGGMLLRGDVAVSAEAGAVPGSAPAQQKDATYSGTNNHEAAADEPDVIKTDGKRIVSILDGTLRVVDTGTRRVTATLALPGYPTAMLLDGDRALVTTFPNDVISDGPYPGMSGGRLTLVLVDLKDGARIAGSLTVDGSYVDARQVGSVARVVTTSQPRLPFVMPTEQISQPEALQRNKDVIARSKIDDWIPRYHPGNGAEGALYDCSSLSKPANYTGTSVLSVLTFDLRADLGTGDGVGIVANGHTVYGTANSLYVADDRQNPIGIMPAEGSGKPVLPRAAPEQTTSVHQFDIANPGKPVYLASGVVNGGLLNQYSLSEHKGNLRIATTKADQGCCNQAQQSESSVVVLTRRGPELAEIGRVDGLGKTERIFSVRFIGDTGYVVTFRRTDPLYTVDLSDPTKPKIAGELKITGYSAYLHPVGTGRLLGVGQEATEQGRVAGTQVSLFDTTAAQARRITQFQVKGASSEVEFDAHAFLYWADKGLVVVPLNENGAREVGGGATLPGAVVLKVSGDSITEVARLSHPASQQYGDVAIRRSLVAGNALWTVSGSGMLASDLDGLTQLAWVPFA